MALVAFVIVRRTFMHDSGTRRRSKSSEISGLAFFFPSIDKRAIHQLYHHPQTTAIKQSAASLRLPSLEAMPPQGEGACTFAHIQTNKLTTTHLHRQARREQLDAYSTRSVRRDDASVRRSRSPMHAIFRMPHCKRRPGRLQARRSRRSDSRLCKIHGCDD